MTTPYSTTAANATNDKVDSLTEFEGVVNSVIETLIEGFGASRLQRRRPTATSSGG